MAQLEFKHIEAICAVIRQGSASAAARQLGLTQPAVSKIIAKAEERVGFSLFDRRQGKLVPTQAAMSFYEQSAQLFATLDRVQVILDRMVRGQITPIQIGMVPLLTNALLPDILKETGDTIGAERSLEVQSHDSVILSNMVAAGQMEFAIVSAMHPMDGVGGAPFVQSPCYVALPPDHPLATRAVLHPEDLHGRPFIGLSSAEAIQTGLSQLFQLRGVTPVDVIRCPLMAGALRLAEEGLGLTLVDSFAMHLARPGRVVFVPFAPEFTIEFRAIWPLGQQSAFDRRGFMVKAQSVAQRLIAQSAQMVRGG